jgi:hypothetical protein
LPGLNFQRATQLAQPFSHSADSDARSPGRRHQLQFVRRNPFAVILDFDQNLAFMLAQDDLGCGAVGMAMNIGQ